MLGKNHIIAGSSIFGTLSLGVIALSNTETTNGIGTMFVSGAQFLVDYYDSFDGMLNIVALGVYVILFLIGTLLPDIDSPTSFFGRAVRINVKHRTWTHSIWIVLCLLILSIWVWQPLIWLTSGYFIHLFLDSLSRGGVCWLYPISKHKTYSSGAMFKPGQWLRLYKVGKTSEYVVVTVCVMLFITASALTFDLQALMDFVIR